MRIDIHHHVHVVDESRIEEVIRRLHMLQQGQNNMSERLSREIQETRDAVTALTGRYQTKIDEMQTQIDALKAALAEEDVEAANAAADALDALQTELNAINQAPVGGDTTVPPEGGNDTLTPGEGNDTVDTGAGNDVMDTAVGGDGDDEVQP